MTFVVGPRAAQAGHRVIVHERLDSTNSEALRLARAGERGPLWIVARDQTAGRGRRGREWISAPGNLDDELAVHRSGHAGGRGDARLRGEPCGLRDMRDACTGRCIRRQMAE